jgi:hypothetical protein
MHLDQLRAVWHQHLDRSPDRADIALVARLVEQFARNFERQIHRRDIIETAAALAVVALFAPSAMRLPTLVGKIGCLVTVAGAVLVVAKLWSARRAGKRPAEPLPLSDFLSGEREHLVRQIRLLRSVAWWYISPLLLGANLIVWATLPSTTWFVCYLVATVLFGLLVWWWNQQAVQRDLQPLLEEIDRVIRQLTSEA